MLKRPLVFTASSYAVGITAGHYFVPDTLPLFAPLIIFFLLLFYLVTSNKSRFYALLLVFFMVGVIIDKDQHRPSRLIEISQNTQNVRVYGTVSQINSKTETTITFNLIAKGVHINNLWEKVSEYVEVVVKHNPPELFVGQEVLLFGTLEPIRGFLTPGAFNSVEQKRIRNIQVRFKVKDGRYLILLKQGQFLGSNLIVLRKNYLSFIQYHLDDENYPIGAAILLGERALLQDTLKDRFAKTGLSHVLVVSGLHVGLLGTVAFFFLRSVLVWLPLSFKGRGIICFLATISLIVFYVGITGFHVSGQRAMLMAIVVGLSIIIYKNTDAFTTLFAAALIILFLNPHYLFTLSFQLSFLSVLGILWANKFFIKPIVNMVSSKTNMKSYLKKAIIYFYSLLIISVSVNLFLLPLLIYNFNQFSVIGIFANLICVPIVGILIVPFGIISLLLVPFSKTIASYTFFPCYLGIYHLNEISKFFSNVPFAYLNWFTPHVWEILVYYTILLISFIKMRGKKLAFYSLVALLIFIFIHILSDLYPPFKEKNTEITFLDVGQGSSCVVRLPGGKNILIDAGGLPDTDFDIGKNVVAKFLWANRIRELDLAILTHPDYDHMQGFDYLLEHFKIKKFLAFVNDLPKEFRDRLLGRNTLLLDAFTLSALQEKDYILRIFHPNPDTLGFCNDHNDRSLILKLQNNTASILITGDNGGRLLDQIAKLYGPELNAEVLLIPHHGSKNSLSMELYRSVSPKLAVVSSGYKNPYSFPNREVVASLNELKIPLVSTKESGSIRLIFQKAKNEEHRIKEAISFRNGKWTKIKFVEP